MKLKLLIPNSYLTEEVNIEVGDTIYHNNGGSYHPFEVIKVLERSLNLKYLRKDHLEKDFEIEKSFDTLYNHGWHKENIDFTAEEIEPPILEDKSREGKVGDFQFWVFNDDNGFSSSLYIQLYMLGVSKYFLLDIPEEKLIGISDRKIIQTLTKSCSFTFAELELMIKNAKWDKYQEIKAQLNKI